MNNRVIITGASGFIGGTLAAYFSQRNYEVTGVSIDEVQCAIYPVRRITYQVETVSNLVDELEPSLFIHAAGPASVEDSLVNPKRDFSNSVTLFQTVLEGVRRSNYKPRVVFLSSAAVYGNPDTLPVKETAELRPISPYGYHKVMCETLAREYSSCFSVPTLAVRLFSVFGPKQKRLLLWELFQQFYTKPEVVVEGTGNESRDYLYIDDFAELLLRVISRINDEYLQLNIASGASVTVREISMLIKKHLNSKKRIVYQGKVRAGNPSHWQADISCMQKLIGNNIDLKFDDALKFCLSKWSTENK